MFDVLRTALPFREAGRIRMLAVASAQRSPLAPAELETFMRADMAKWGEVIKTARIRAD